jgi:hypothetical protein
MHVKPRRDSANGALKFRNLPMTFYLVINVCNILIITPISAADLQGDNLSKYCAAVMIPLTGV